MCDLFKTKPTKKGTMRKEKPKKKTKHKNNLF